MTELEPLLRLREQYVKEIQSAQRTLFATKHKLSGLDEALKALGHTPPGNGELPIHDAGKKGRLRERGEGNAERVLAELSERPNQTPAEIAGHIDLDRQAVYSALQAAKKRGRVTKNLRGEYRLPTQPEEQGNVANGSHGS